MPGGLQPKKAAKLNHQILGMPQTLQGSGQTKNAPRKHPKSRNMNPADLQPNDSSVGGGWTNHYAY